jgi:hypothetical protein
VLKPYLKKLPFFVQIVNSIWFQAVMMLNKALLVGNSVTTWKTKHPWIRILFSDGAIMVKKLVTAQKNEEMPITVRVPPTLFAYTYIIKASMHPNWMWHLDKCHFCFVFWKFVVETLAQN